MTEIISRNEAIEHGLKRYFTGEPCERKHLCERFVGNRLCIECKRIHTLKWEKNNLERRRKNARVWASKNRERVKAIAAKTRSKNFVKMREANKKWHEENREYTLEKSRKKYKAVSNLIAVLRTTMPELIKEFGL